MHIHVYIYKEQTCTKCLNAQYTNIHTGKKKMLSSAKKVRWQKSSNNRQTGFFPFCTFSQLRERIEKRPPFE